MTDTLSRCRGDRYALSALKHKRAAIASDIAEAERKLRHLKEALVHVDATLLLLDPEANPEDHEDDRRQVRTDHVSDL